MLNAGMDLIVFALVVAVAVVAAGIIVRFALERSAARRQQEAGWALLQNQLGGGIQQAAVQIETLRTALGEAMQSLSGQLTRALEETHKNVGARLDNTTQVIGDVRQQLGQLEQSSRRMVELGQDISKLEQILHPPKLRGALGELFLADLLAQVLPGSHYRLQHHFKGGEIVDAVVLLRGGMVSIDAKFPLDNFRRILAAGSDEERLPARRAFVKDIRGHVDDISRKYIRVDEGTFDFALMYVPAENVYYETIIKDDEFGGEMALFNYALRKRVIPVSPNSFYAYLQTIILGLKGMRVEEKSREILENLSRLQKEFDNFSDAFRLVGQHLDNSAKKYAEAEKRFGKMEAKVEQIDGLTRGLEAAEEEPARALAADADQA